MYVTWQSIVTLAAVAAAVAALLGYYNKAHKWFLKQEKQDADIKAIKEEQTLIVYGVLACLRGLKEQGCDGPVTAAIDKMEKHINVQAHK